MDIGIDLIERFDKHLKNKGLAYSASIIGGAAILLVANKQRSTGDIDSLSKIPNKIKEEIRLFAGIEGIDPNWFNDNAARNYSEFVRKGQDIFSKKVFKGEALELFVPSTETLLLSKIYPMIDRFAEGQDFEDIESLIVTGSVSKDDMEKAIDIFNERIRFEEDPHHRKISREIVKTIRTFIETVKFKA